MHRPSASEAVVEDCRFDGDDGDGGGECASVVVRTAEEADGRRPEDSRENVCVLMYRFYYSIKF
jgi:hypothetical protein